MQKIEKTNERSLRYLKMDGRITEGLTRAIRHPRENLVSQIDMNNGQTRFIISEMSIFGGTLKNITKYSNLMCKY